MEQSNPSKRPRLNNSSAASYFEAPASRENAKGVLKEYYKCTKCKKEINGTKKSNLVKHIKTHEDLYSMICNDDHFEKKRLKLLLDCVEFVAVDGNAFSRLNGSGLLSMLETTLNELQAAGQGVNLKDPHFPEVKQMLHETAESIRRKISAELENRLFCLMVDITTKRRRSILGVSVQFIDNGKHKIRSIGMLELNESHTGEYLAKVICSLLSEYGLKPQQVIAITTDNGANVVKMVRDITAQIISMESRNQNAVHNECDEDIDSCDYEIESYLQNVPDITDEQALELLFDCVDSEDEINENDILENGALLNEMITNWQNPDGNICTVNGVRCAVHTLQLGIHDGTSKLSKANRNVIALCRRIAKTIRLQSTSHELKQAGIEFTVPHLDVTTRWCSTYVMVCMHTNHSDINSFFSTIRFKLNGMISNASVLVLYSYFVFIVVGCGENQECSRIFCK